MVNDIVNNVMRHTESIVTNLPSNPTSFVADTNGNVFNVNYNLNSGPASFMRGSQEGNGSSSYSYRTAGPSASARSFPESSSADGGDSSSTASNTFYQTKGPSYTKNVFITTNGGYMSNVGNTISILGGP